MKILVVGSGGREHSFCWTLAKSPQVTDVLCAPGNAGIAAVARCVPVAVDDLEGLVRLSHAEAIDLVVVGPELPLVLGLVDRLEAAGIKALGPRAAAARLEASKAFTKSFCERHRIPTARHRTFGAAEADAARDYVRAQGAPIVIKADGLAAGKGVVVATRVDEALSALDDAFGGAFGEAGAVVVVEECLVGEEASLFALCDGTTALPLGTAQDHKRAFDGDQGPNTGGMGAYSPASILEGAMTERVMAEIVRPTLAGMAAEGAPFMGFLYAGLMLTADGPKLIEYNVRFGDPEAQVVLPRLDTDLATLLTAAVEGRLDAATVRWSDRHALTVVMAAKGYPGTYAKGTPIGGLERLAADPDLVVFHAGTQREGGGRIVGNGGRVLGVTGFGRTLREAAAKAYSGVDRIDWPGGFCRRDIGQRELERA